MVNPADRPATGPEPRPWSSPDSALHGAVWTMAASARIPLERREEFTRMGVDLLRAELGIRGLRIEAVAAPNSSDPRNQMVRKAATGEDAAPRTDLQVTRNRLLSQLPSDYRPMLDEYAAAIEAEAAQGYGEPLPTERTGAAARAKGHTFDQSCACWECHLEAEAEDATWD